MRIANRKISKMRAAFKVHLTALDIMEAEFMPRGFIPPHKMYRYLKYVRTFDPGELWYKDKVLRKVFYDYRVMPNEAVLAYVRRYQLAFDVTPVGHGQGKVHGITALTTAENGELRNQIDRLVRAAPSLSARSIRDFCIDRFGDYLIVVWPWVIENRRPLIEPSVVPMPSLSVFKYRIEEVRKSIDRIA